MTPDTPERDPDEKPPDPPRGPSDEEPQDPNRITDPKIADAAVSAWLAAFFSSPAGHRSNAQNGYTIAAAVATAIVGAGILTSVDEAPIWVQIPLLLALGLWLIAAWRFMQAVAFQPNLGGVIHAHDEATLGTAAIQRTWRERALIARRGKVARRYATSAGIATFFALLVVLARPMFTKVDATVALTGSGIKHVTALCGKAPPGGKITARVDPEALDDALVLLDDAPCPDKTKRTLRLAKGDIAGTATN